MKWTIFKRIQKILLYALAVYGLFGFLILPLILKSQIVEIVQKETNARLSLESVYFNPFNFQLKISGIELTSQDNKHLLSLHSLFINLELYSLAASAVHVKNFILEKPEISLVYKKDKTFNFSDIIKQSSLKTEENASQKIAIPRIIIDKFTIKGGKLDYEDFTHKTKFDFSFHNIGLNLKNIDTNDFNTSDAELRFYSSLEDGGFIDLKTKIFGFKPLVLNGSLNFNSSKLYTEWRYMQDSLNLEVADGKISFYTDYHLNLDDLNSTTLYNMHGSVHHLRIKPKGYFKDILKLDSFYFKDTTIKPMLQDIHVKKIGFDSLYAKVRRDAQGKIDWLTYLESKSKNPMPQLKSTKIKKKKIAPWRVKIEDIALKRIKVDYSDKGVNPQIDAKLKELNINLKNISLSESKSEIIVDVAKSNLKINNLSIKDGVTNEKILGLSNFDVNGVSLNTKTKNVLIEKIALGGLDIAIKRLKNGNLNIPVSIVPDLNTTTLATITKEAKNSEQYKVLLKHFALDSANLNFEDNFLSQKTHNKIDMITLNAYNIDSQDNSWLQYELSLRVNSKGYLKSHGSLSHTPLKQNGTFEVQNISLKELNPYLQENLYLNIDDGLVSLKGQTQYEKSQTHPDLKVDGSFKVDELFVSDSRDKTSLLSCNKIGLNSFTLEMFPNRFFVNELNLDSFYINAIINQDKTMNLSSLTKKKEGVHQALNEHNTKTEVQEKFPIKILKLNVTLGSANFEDNSLPVKFQANIHDLDGVAYLLSTQKDEISYINMAGEIDKYGSTNLEGSITLGTPKLYTDLNLNFKNLELQSLSGYSASFAGYKIKRGKLYLDLNYNILDSKLLGKNSIKIKKIKLGEEFHDNNKSSLPLGFAIALLEDSDGLIDIDMPVKGNVDEPQFKYSTIIYKALGNLILKAVASPFKFLGSLMGLSSDKFESIEFKSGSNNILAPQREKLDSIVKMMGKRPKLSLSISGTYDAILDKHALQREKLLDMAMQKSKDNNNKNNKSFITVDLLEMIYRDFKTNDKLQELKEKLKNQYKDKELDRQYLAALIEECTSIQPFSVEELVSLANQRGDNIKKYLVNERGLNEARIKLLKIKTVHEQDKTMVKTGIELEVNE